jgi:uncharacterized membrane protein (DUF373 family)
MKWGVDARAKRRHDADFIGGLPAPLAFAIARPVWRARRRCCKDRRATPRTHDGDRPMLNIEGLKKDWQELTSYHRFEHVVSRIIMLFISIVIVYSLALVAIDLVKDFALGQDFMGAELMQDIFGSILTVLILLEFNHSIASSLTKRSGILQVRIVVLIAILVVARKIILLDFKNESLEHLAGISAMGLSLGALYWLLGAGSAESSSTARPPGHG